MKCIVEECVKDAHSKQTGYCSTHQRNYRLYGTPYPKSKPSLEEVLWSNAVITPYCWVWTGSFWDNGYGAIYDARVKNNIGTHRAALEIKLKRPIKSNLLACHRCHNRACINPSHLYEGSQSDNRNDMYSRKDHVHYHSAQTHCKRGHEFNAANTYFFITEKDGKDRITRICKPCKKIRYQEKTRASS